MTKTPKQQTFSLKTLREQSFANFIAGENQEILNQLQKMDAQTAIYLWGESGSGCTHLLHACAIDGQKKGLYALYVDLRSCDWSLLFAASEHVQLLLIDHMEAAETAEQQEILFYIFNRAVHTPYPTVWAAHVPPDQLPLKLADLRSRLEATLIYHVETLGDTDKRLVLQSYAKSLGLQLNVAVARFLLTHYPRALKEQLSLLDQLDKVSLQFQRRLTIPFLKQFLSVPV